MIRIISTTNYLFLTYVILIKTIFLHSYIFAINNENYSKSLLVDVKKISGQMVLDGALDEAQWKKAQAIENFLEFKPGDNVSPPKKTKAMVLYDEENLYVGFIAEDDPSEIRATIQKRDMAWQDDWVAIILDTYGDANSSVMIASNPLGMQIDGLNKADGNDDPSYDIIYKSYGIITDEGYQVEMAIPFSSLSFPKQDIQNWKVTFFRNMPRDVRHQINWGGLDRNDPCWICQMGTMTGIKNISQKGKIEFLPSIVGSRSTNLDENERYLPNQDNSELSIGLKYSLSSDLALELSLNPDFSQIESDVEQININSTFAINFPEKRPFFNEGSDLTNMWINTIYTRSINNPSIVGRVINRGQDSNWSFISAQDESTPFIVPSEEKSTSALGGKSISNIFRYKRPLNLGSHVGLALTDRRMLDGQGSGSTLSLDSRYRFNDTYQIEFQTVFSHTLEPNNSDLLSSDIVFGEGYTKTFDGESFTGDAMELELSRRTEHWNLELGYDHRSPTFRADNGFITENNQRSLYLMSFWNYFSEGFFSEVTGGFRTGIEPNFQGQMKTRYYLVMSNLVIPRQTRIHLMYARRPLYRFKNTNLYDTWDAVMRINSNFNKRISFGGSIGRHLAPIRFLEIPTEGWASINSIRFRYQATDRINLGIEYNSQKMTSRDKKTDYYSGGISTLRIRYQHNKSLGLKLFGMYSDFSNDFQLQPLITYQPSPFTIFYIGSNTNRQMEYLSYQLVQDIEPRNKEYYIKFQYMF